VPHSVPRTTTFAAGRPSPVSASRT